MLILASSSPRRKELLSFITDDFKVIKSEIDESYSSEMKPSKIVERLAFRKAQVVFQNQQNDIVIGADTVVSIENEILGKPTDREQAREMLKKLSGEWHQVYTGVAIIAPNYQDVFSVCSNVQFYSIKDEEIDEYIATGEPMDKAGAYGIQKHGAKFVSEIRGDFFGIVGLPVGELYQKLKKIEEFKA